MPANIKAVNIVATKQASGTVQILFCDRNTATVRFAAVIPAADFTSLNTTVNGGATGATLTLIYPENANRTDFPVGYQGEEV